MCVSIFLHVRLVNAYSRPKIGVLGVKVGESGNIFNFILLGIQHPGTDTFRIKRCKNRWCGLGSRREQNFGVTN